MSANITVELLVGIEEVAKSAAHTQGKETISLSVEKWIDMLHSEHTPIRVMQLRINICNFEYYSAMHLVRHTQGIIPFVRSQRPEGYNPVGYDRKKAPQDAPTNYRPVLNPQSLINISRKRMCHHADEVTRAIWFDVRNAIEKHEDPYVSAISKVMMPDCMYRGGVCHELKCCGFSSHWKSASIDED